ncbi:MAG: STAS domain-containing protein [Candidatus Thiodiazotropha sp. (ex Dulcina madagascariensis)]|nr:STAS domain-containing protein [Candidatus Thiodiazotropha sp. (ex Dulcina madagascariensis)]MCU7927163.1 STAS domain-containing protein [Candidatus Thiodiazotropha sp. (ex Dulcina madagascariensis)]
MQVDMRSEDGILLLEPVGDIDGKTAPDFQQQVLAVMEPRAHVVLNLERVAFMSSAGLRSMLLIYREAQTKNAKVVLAEVNKNIRNSMSATGFLSFFVVYDTVRDGIQSAN